MKICGYDAFLPILFLHKAVEFSLAEKILTVGDRIPFYSQMTCKVLHTCHYTTIFHSHKA